MRVNLDLSSIFFNKDSFKRQNSFEMRKKKARFEIQAFHEKVNAFFAFLKDFEQEPSFEMPQDKVEIDFKKFRNQYEQEHVQVPTEQAAPEAQASAGSSAQANPAVDQGAIRAGTVVQDNMGSSSSEMPVNGHLEAGQLGQRAPESAPVETPAPIQPPQAPEKPGPVITPAPVQPPQVPGPIATPAPVQPPESPQVPGPEMLDPVEPVVAEDAVEAADDANLSREEVRNQALSEIDERMQEINDITNDMAYRITEGVYSQGEVSQEEFDAAQERFDQLRSEISEIVENTSFEGEALLQGGAAENADMRGLVDELEDIDFSTQEGAESTYRGKIYDGRVTKENASVYHAQETFSTEIDRLAQTGSGQSQREATIREALGDARGLLDEAAELTDKAASDSFYDEEGNEVEVTDEMRAEFNERFEEIRQELGALIENTADESGQLLQGGSELNADLSHIDHFLNEQSDISTQEGAESAFYDVYSAQSIVSEEGEKVESNNVQLEELGKFQGPGFYIWVD